MPLDNEEDPDAAAGELTLDKVRRHPEGRIAVLLHSRTLLLPFVVASFVRRPRILGVVEEEVLCIVESRLDCPTVFPTAYLIEKGVRRR